jgi:two-component system, NtrC family, response regulator HydG
MSVGMQVKLLRVLQERELTRVGGEEVLRVDVRVIAATNRDLLKEVGAGRFREDLFYRLNVVMLQVPPLRERPEDIPLLAQEFLIQFAGKNHKAIKGFTPQAMDRLLRHSWPGNVRELMNSVERGVVLSRGEYLDETELSLLLPGAGPSPAGKAAPPAPGAEGHSLEKVERETILKTLDAARGNKSEAARRLGITRRTLHQKLRKYEEM